MQTHKGKLFVVSSTKHIQYLKVLGAFFFFLQDSRNHNPETQKELQFLILFNVTYPEKIFTIQGKKVWKDKQNKNL